MKGIGWAVVALGLLAASTVAMAGPAIAAPCPVYLDSAHVVGISPDARSLRYDFTLLAKRTDAFSIRIGLGASDGTAQTILEAHDLVPVGSASPYRVGVDVWVSGKLGATASIMSVTHDSDGTTVTCDPDLAPVLAQEGPVTQISVVDPSLIPTIQPSGISGVTAFTDAWISIRAQPDYPNVARDEDIEGDVTVKVQVGPGGGSAPAVLERSSGNKYLDQAALEAARNSKFNPAVYAGAVIAGGYEVVYTFLIDDSGGPTLTCPADLSSADVAQVGRDGNSWLLSMTADALSPSLRSLVLDVRNPEGDRSLQINRTAFDFPEKRAEAGENLDVPIPILRYTTSFEYLWSGGELGSVYISQADLGDKPTSCKNTSIRVEPSFGSAAPEGPFDPASAVVPVHPAVFASLVLPDTTKVPRAQAVDHETDIIVTANADGSTASAAIVGPSTNAALDTAALTAVMASEYVVTDDDLRSTPILYHVRYRYVETRDGYLNAVLSGQIES